MARSSVGLEAVLSVMTLAACGAEQAEESRATGELAAPAGNQGTSVQRIRAYTVLCRP